DAVQRRSQRRHPAPQHARCPRQPGTAEPPRPVVTRRKHDDAVQGGQALRQPVPGPLARVPVGTKSGTKLGAIPRQRTNSSAEALELTALIAPTSASALAVTRCVRSPTASTATLCQRPKVAS